MTQPQPQPRRTSPLSKTVTSDQPPNHNSGTHACVRVCVCACVCMCVCGFFLRACDCCVQRVGWERNPRPPVLQTEADEIIMGGSNVSKTGASKAHASIFKLIR